MLRTPVHIGNAFSSFQSFTYLKSLSHHRGGTGNNVDQSGVMSTAVSFAAFSTSLIILILIAYSVVVRFGDLATYRTMSRR